MSSLFSRLTAALNYFAADKDLRWPSPVLDINNEPQPVSVERELDLLLYDDDGGVMVVVVW